MPPITHLLDAAKENAIHGWVEDATGLSAIWARQDANRPALPFISLDISSGPRKENTPPVTYKEQDIFTYRFNHVFTLSVNLFALDGHLSLLNRLIQSQDLPSKRQVLESAGIAIHGSSDPLDISQLLETDYEFRATMDWFMAYGEDIDDNTGEIQKVRVQGIDQLDKIDKTIQA